MSSNPTIKFTVSQNEVIADAMATDNIGALRAIVEAARNTLKAGGEVEFTETYDNAPTEVHCSFANVGDFERWVEDQNKILKELGKEEI
ncbi:hypothetical protein [Cupriavidus sp. AcVe19-1a]|uniref:hypothetical protein n=1 Tax=Cupriavidus sp. AcVe19-1a TaxID=2821359 RepID=UPI001AE62F78|nr:hypothetical protein [Cupriavidus sp. AcVe19-1a]MBP0633454.1 hypothetical protein [Cupriavidus sp. AcVe19-1a]